MLLQELRIAPNTHTHIPPPHHTHTPVSHPHTQNVDANKGGDKQVIRKFVWAVTSKLFS